MKELTKKHEVYIWQGGALREQRPMGSSEEFFEACSAVQPDLEQQIAEELAAQGLEVNEKLKGHYLMSPSLSKIWVHSFIWH